MTELEKLNQIFDYITGESKEFNSVQIIDKVVDIKLSLYELERLRKFKATFDKYELAQKQGFIAYENWKECEKELETMKAKVKRYFQLQSYHYAVLPKKSSVEKCKLYQEYKNEMELFKIVAEELKEWSESNGL